MREAIAARIVRLILAVLGASCRFRVVRGGERLAEMSDRQHGPVILTVWHHELFPASYFLWRRLVRRGVDLTVLVSRSRDGELGSRLGEMLGARVVRGSSSRGGSTALRRLHRLLDGRGEAVLIIPDGPRGPSRRFQTGAVQLSRLTGAPVVPLGFGVSRAWRLGSWDRMVVPKPFSRIGVAVGSPYAVPRRSGDLEAERGILEGRMCEAEEAADQSFTDTGERTSRPTG